MDPQEIIIGAGFTIIGEAFAPPTNIGLPLCECNHCGNTYFTAIDNMWLSNCPYCGITWSNT
jgi:hypothetical protein